MSYKTLAILAADLAKSKKISPIEAWQITAQKIFPNSLSSQVKACPKNTFLGLCEAGMLDGIPAGKYTGSALNKMYALIAVELLLHNTVLPITSRELWKETLRACDVDGSKVYNYQMDVVLGLWENGLINI